MERQTFSHPDLHHYRVEFDQSPSQALVWTEVDASRAPVAEDYRSPGSFFDGLILVLWGFSLSFLVVLAVRKLVFHKIYSGEDKSPDQRHVTSCARCQYFNKNPYMKCAVNPLSVQKIDASECPDFTSMTPEP
jgi:hypothetical protein